MRSISSIKLRAGSLVATLLLVPINGFAFAQGTAFTYQGKLNDNGNPANGQYDFQFKLFDTFTVGTGIQQGATFIYPTVTVIAGIFTVQLDFGTCPTCFNGSTRFLEIAVKPSSGSTFTTLGPRQPITSNPYSIRSSSATTADGLSVSCVNCVTSSQIQSIQGSQVTGNIAGNQISGAIPVASVPAGSSNYIQNTASPQSGSNFNISGNGTAGGTLSGNFVNAATEYRLGGVRDFSVSGPYSDLSTTSFMASNIFIGEGAGLNTQPSSVINGESGKFNNFFGAGAGKANTTGNFNSFFGYLAGSHNTIGSQNAFFGLDAGQRNTSGGGNAFFGFVAGWGALGDDNTFIGASTDFDVFLSTGDHNTLLGSSAIVASGSTNATAIGARAQVAQDNSLVLGSINGTNHADADTKVGIGTTAPGALLDVQRDGSTIPETARFTTYGNDNEILGRASGGTRVSPTATPNGTMLLQLGATGHNGNGFVTTPRAAIEMTAAEAWMPGAAGTRMRFNTTTNGTTTTLTRMYIADDGNIGINTTAPDDKLEVNGIIRVNSLGAAGSTSLCRNASSQIATCSSSLRYKTDIAPFIGGLAVIKLLRPITFTWKQDGTRDIGFGAEDVARVAPLFTFRNDRGEIEGVKYDRVSVLLVNAIKEQQTQIEEQQAQITTQLTLIRQQQTIEQQHQAQLTEQRSAIAKQRQEIDALKRLVCASHSRAAACKQRL